MRAAALGCIMVLSACASGTGPRSDAELVIRADLSATSAVMVVVQVSAPDITPTLVFNLPVQNGVASGSIAIPAGSGRVITMRAFDASGIETHRGTITVTAVEGANPTLSLVLNPLAGDLPIIATIGSITLTVTLNPTSVPVGQTSTATVTILLSGSPIPGATPTWATLSPGIASVSTSGVVTGVGEGQTKIVATYGGAAGDATITVTQ